jgi:hypothetical protein
MSRTLFIHITRTGGTSIQAARVATSTRYEGMKPQALGAFKMDNRSAFHINEKFATRAQKHIPYPSLSRAFLTRFDRIFTVVRNPWARVVSHYNIADWMYNYAGDTWWYQEKISWEEYLDRMDSFRMIPSYWHNHSYDQWARQSDWLSGGINKIDVLRYENLQEDINGYFSKHVEIPHLNESKEADYRSYFTDKQAEKVADWFKVDIERWGFNYDSGATRNYWGMS